MSLLGQAKQLQMLAGRTGTRPPPEDVYKVTGYVPRELQRWIEENERRFNSEVVHRRFGKTVQKINKLIKRAVYCPQPNGRYAYLAPTYSQAEDIAWTYLQDYARPLYEYCGIEERGMVNQGRLQVWIPTLRGDRARIRLYGVDSPKQRLRGMYLDGGVGDEWAQIPPSVWTEQVRPMLTDVNRSGVDAQGYPNQWFDFIFTPFGRNHAYTMHRKAEAWYAGESVTEKDPDTDEEVTVKRDDWFACLYKASETKILAPDELRDALNDMGRSKYDQEFECSFDAAVEGAIFARELEDLREQGRVCEVPWNKILPVNTAWDLGWDDATAIWFFQQVGERINVIDYYEASGAGLDHYADIMAERRYRYGYNLFPHDVAVHELGTGKSRESILRELGVRVSTVPKHSIWDGISASQAVLSRCYFDKERCAEGLDRLALYRREFNEKLGILRQKPVHDWTSHGADAFRTLAVGLRNMRVGGRSIRSMTHAEM